MVNYFLNKYSLISEEAEEIKNLIPQEIEDNNKEYLKIFKQEEQKMELEKKRLLFILFFILSLFFLFDFDSLLYSIFFYFLVSFFIFLQPKSPAST